jgi:hypothetical protein
MAAGFGRMTSVRAAHVRKKQNGLTDRLADRLTYSDREVFDRDESPRQLALHREDESGSGELSVLADVVGVCF